MYIYRDTSLPRVMFILILSLLSFVACNPSGDSHHKVVVYDGRSTDFRIVPESECYYTWGADTRNLIASTTTIKVGYTSLPSIDTNLVYCRVEPYPSDSSKPTPKPSPPADGAFNSSLTAFGSNNNPALIMFAQVFVLVFWRSHLRHLIPVTYSCIAGLVEILGNFSILVFWIARALGVSAKALEVPKTFTYAAVFSQLLLAAL